MGVGLLDRGAVRPTGASTTAERLGQALLALLPVHALAPDVGVALKPWLVVLAVAVVVLWRDLLPALRALPVAVRLGGALLLVGGLAGLVARPSLLAARHLVALGAVLLLVVVWQVVRPSRAATLVALRIGAVLIVLPALVESMLLLAGRRSGLVLDGVDGLVAPLGAVVYGDILVPHGLHVDSNFLALYAATWVFLLLGHRPPGRTGTLDAVLVGGLLATIVVSLSRGGVIALLVAGVVWLLVRPGRRLPGRAWGVALLSLAAATALVVAADAVDGVDDLGRSVLKRVDATHDEGGSLLGGLGSLGGGYDDAEVAEELAEYTQWSPPRSVLWAAYADAATDHPVTGIGFGTGSVEFRNYAHNVLLEAGAGGGVAALMGTVLLGIGGVVALGGRRPLDRRDAAVAAAGAAVLAGSMLLSTNYSPLVAVVLAMMLAPPRPQSVDP